jgi:hypothetical protein
MHLGRIEFIIVLFTDWSFASGCSPPRLSTTHLPSATDKPVLLSDRDFHPTIGAYFQAHSSGPFGAKTPDLLLQMSKLQLTPACVLFAPASDVPYSSFFQDVYKDQARHSIK